MATTTETKAVAPAINEYADLVLTLQQVVHNMPALLDAIKDHPDEGPRVALQVAMDTLMRLWATSNPDFFEHRSRCLVGFVKGTKDHGNTSVSMGAAWVYFGANPSRTHVMFFNCGTGPAKAQLYSNFNGIIALVKEWKPNSGVSINAVATGKYTPKDAPLTPEAAKQLFADWVTELRATWAIPADTELGAFVTGTIREHYFKAPTNEMVAMYKTINDIFHSLNVAPAIENRWFLLQDTEGELEVKGTARMYEQLADARLISSGARVMTSFGIGRGSLQFAMMDGVGTDTLGHNAGMNDLVRLAEFGRKFTEVCADPTNSHTRYLHRVMSSIASPVIALKSGPMLLFEKNPSLLKYLQQPIPWAAASPKRKADEAPMSE